MELPNSPVRSGGHTYAGGAANIDGGITVDMRGMQTVALNAESTVASISGGAIWSEDVYHKLALSNLTVVGARLPGIGVGGFLTGGK
jgi:FAD/FMN-containing dehydrogenase